MLRDTDPTLYRKLQQLGAEDCMFAYRCGVDPLIGLPTACVCHACLMYPGLSWPAYSPCLSRCAPFSLCHCLANRRMVVVMLRRELPPVACCTLWEMQWAHEAAEGEACAAAGGGLGGSSSRASFRQQQTGAVAGGEGGEGVSRTSSDGAASAATATAAAGLRSTVHGLSEATASARAAAALGQRPASSGGRQSGSARLSAAVPDGSSGEDQPPEFVLQFIAAVVRAQRGRIMTDCREHDDVLRLFNSLQIEFWPSVAQARKQHKAYVGLGAVVRG